MEYTEEYTDEVCRRKMINLWVFNVVIQHRSNFFFLVHEHYGFVKICDKFSSVSHAKNSVQKINLLII